MKFSSATESTSHLKVFTDETPDNRNTSLMAEQLPFVSDLAAHFEAVTGWQVSFKESRSNRAARLGQPHNQTLMGHLEITDMSDQIDPGKSARHRGYCERLLGTLDEMVQLIQSDRHQRTQDNCRLASVVDVPFDWWDLHGKTGFADGRFCTWAVSSEERIRTFCGKVSAETQFEQAICSSMVLAAFENSCQVSLPLEEIAPTMPFVLQKPLYAQARFDWFSTVELDPITGEYIIDGFNPVHGLSLIDVHTATVCPLADDEREGMLYASQILGVGLTPVEQQRISQIITGRELTVFDCQKILTTEFSNAPLLFLFRK